MNSNNEIQKIKNLVSEEVWDIFVECNVMIAGGALTSVFCNREVNDLDVYVRNKEDFFKLIEIVYSKDSNYKLIATNVTNRSVLFKDTETQQDVQVIVYKFFDNLDAVFNDYDFTINMCGLNCVDEQMQFHPEFFKHNSQRYLQFHTGTAYPIISALRVQKYVEKGYTISKSQMLRLLLTISKLKIESWADLKDDIGGMYGLNMDNVFPEKEEFSMEKAIDVLDALQSDNTFRTHVRSVPRDEIFDTFLSRFGDDRKEVKGTFFKNVMVTPDNRYVSQYQEKFEYKIHEIVDGGSAGIYCYDGYDVVSGIYATYPENVILELKLLSDIPPVYTKSDNRYQLMGKVFVVAVYTHMEFIAKFKKSAVVLDNKSSDDISVGVDVPPKTPSIFSPKLTAGTFLPSGYI